MPTPPSRALSANANTGQPQSATPATTTGVVAPHAKRRPRRPLLTPRQFAGRMAASGSVAAGMLAAMLLVGVLGYHFLVGLAWVDALLNASMILSGMGPVDPVKSASGKIFASFYAIASGVVFITTMGVFLSPFLHRVLHKYHLEWDEGEK